MSWVSMCSVWPLHSKWLSEWSNEFASNFALSSSIPPWKLFGWFRRPQLWSTGDSSWQCICSCITSHPEVFGEISNHPGDSAPYDPDLAPCYFWLFPKLKSPLKGKRFQTIDEIQENTMGQLMVIGRTVWGPNVNTWKGTEATLSYVQCFLYLLQ